MNISELFSPSMIQIGSDAKNKDALLHELAALAQKNETLKKYNVDELYQAFLQREKISTTGFGNGVAIPHCTIDGIDEFVLGILIDPKGVAFDAMDSKKVHVLILIIAPQTRRTEHIKVLSAVSRILNNKSTVKQLTNLSSPEEVYALLTQALTPSSITPIQTAHTQLQVAIQDRDQFNDIIQLFSEQDNCSVSVIETHDARDYLSTMPLFASFWNSQQKGFQRIIIAVLPKGHANDVIRRINLLQESDQKEGLLVTLMDLTYAGGSLTL